ncbi:MAG: hypothetical protein KJO81_08085 [Gammaproteobacteria bacterium]|nr:hypothetical protein [Gammaproteobacteria bacterium]
MVFTIDDATFELIKGKKVVEVECAGGPGFVGRANHKYPEPVGLSETYEFFAKKDGVRAGRIFFEDDTFLAFHRGQKAKYESRTRYECEDEYSFTTTAEGLKILLGLH